MKSKTGNSTPFPEVSNTRYASLLEAVRVVLKYRVLYIELLHFVRDSKVNRALNNMEANVLKGLEDYCTLDELGVFVLYYESISHPFIQAIRSPGLEGRNALDLGPFFIKLKNHIKKLINSPSLLLDPKSDSLTASLTSQDSWRFPEAVAAVQDHAKTSDHIEELLIAFLTGALATWDRFASEYEADGPISRLTDAQRSMAWVPSTNDANEGALGQYRLYARANPRGTLLYFNSKTKCLKNNTQDFINYKLNTEPSQSHLRKLARDRDSFGIDRKRQANVMDEQIQLVNSKRIKIQEQARKKEARTRRTLEVNLILDLEELRGQSNATLKEQLARLALEDPLVPSFSQFNKAQLIEALVGAIERYKIKNLVT